MACYTVAANGKFQNAPDKNERISVRGWQVKPMDKVKRIIEAIRTLMEKEFTGYLKVNFSQGNVGRIEKFEEILKK